MSYANKITVITPESFNEFLSEAGDSVEIDETGHLKVTEVQEEFITRIKVYAPGRWETVDSELVVIEGNDDE